MSYTKKNIKRRVKLMKKKKQTVKKKQQSFISTGQPDSVNQSGIQVERMSLIFKFVLALLGLLLGGWLTIKGITDDHFCLTIRNFSINTIYVGLPIVIIIVLFVIRLITPKINISR